MTKLLSKVVVKMAIVYLLSMLVYEFLMKWRLFIGILGESMARINLVNQGMQIDENNWHRSRIPIHGGY